MNRLVVNYLLASPKKFSQRIFVRGFLVILETKWNTLVNKYACWDFFCRLLEFDVILPILNMLLMSFIKFAYFYPVTYYATIKKSKILKRTNLKWNKETFQWIFYKNCLKCYLHKSKQLSQFLAKSIKTFIFIYIKIFF